MLTGTYTTTVAGVEVLMHISTYSATVVQLNAWNALWSRLLGGSAAPQRSPEGGVDDVQGGRL
jgi:hypothetical protein